MDPQCMNIQLDLCSRQTTEPFGSINRLLTSQADHKYQIAVKELRARGTGARELFYDMCNQDMYVHAVDSFMRFLSKWRL